MSQEDQLKGKIGDYFTGGLMIKVRVESYFANGEADVRRTSSRNVRPLVR